MTFATLEIPSPLRAAIAARGFDTPTPVQTAVLDPTHAGRDLLVTSQTGSGKTLAFGLAVSGFLGAGEPRRTPRVLVVAPTRELALQVARELSWLYGKSGARVATCVGGMDMGAERRALAAGAAIVVGTPGRICDHLERKSLDLRTLDAAILDEADEMLDMGFREELERILGAASAERRTLMFSATFPKEMEQLAKRFTREPVRVRASDTEAPHADIEYLAHVVAPREREHAVVNVLRFHDAPSALVFCATRDGVTHLHGGLVERGFLAVALSGELSQNERNRAIGAVREGRARVLVATDVAARGIDLPAVALVVHADLPHDAAVLQHRSGRTGRAGRKGTAVVLVPFIKRRRAEMQLKAARIPVRFTPPPSADQIRALDQQRMATQIQALAADLEPEDMDGAQALAALLPAESLAAVLVRSLRRTLPAAEELRESTAPARTSPPRERDRDGDRGPPRGPPRERDRDGERGRKPARGPRHDDDEGPSRGGGDDEGTWFRVNVGREQRADPKWLVPMLCRRGKITKRELGRFEIRRRDTLFSVDPKAARRFEEAAGQPDKQDPKVRIVRERGGRDLSL